MYMKLAHIVPKFCKLFSKNLPSWNYFAEKYSTWQQCEEVRKGADIGGRVGHDILILPIVKKMNFRKYTANYV